MKDAMTRRRRGWMDPKAGKAPVLYAKVGGSATGICFKPEYQVTLEEDSG